MVGPAAAETLINLVIRGPARRHVGMTAACSSDPWSACSCGPLDAEQRIAHHVAVACEHMTDRIVVWRASRAPGTVPPRPAGPYPCHLSPRRSPSAEFRQHRPGDALTGDERPLDRGGVAVVAGGVHAFPDPRRRGDPERGRLERKRVRDLVTDQQVPVAGRPSPQLGEVLTDGDLVPGARPATAGQARRLHEVPAGGRVGRCGVADHGGVLDRT